MAQPKPVASEQKPYPGEAASVEQLLSLAEEYGLSSKLLLSHGRRGAPLSFAPFRLAALQAIELYLSALLLHAGSKPSQIRKMNHDLSLRARVAIDKGLKLRQRTANHLTDVTQAREYLISRYDPEMVPTTSQTNRLAATLDEVAKKVRQFVAARRC